LATYCICIYVEKKLKFGKKSVKIQSKFEILAVSTILIIVVSHC